MFRVCCESLEICNSLRLDSLGAEPTSAHQRLRILAGVRHFQTQPQPGDPLCRQTILSLYMRSQTAV